MGSGAKNSSTSEATFDTFMNSMHGVSKTCCETNTSCGMLMRRSWRRFCSPCFTSTLIVVPQLSKLCGIPGSMLMRLTTTAGSSIWTPFKIAPYPTHSRSTTSMIPNVLPFASPSLVDTIDSRFNTILLRHELHSPPSMERPPKKRRPPSMLPWLPLPIPIPPPPELPRLRPNQNCHTIPSFDHPLHHHRHHLPHLLVSHQIQARTAFTVNH